MKMSSFPFFILLLCNFCMSYSSSIHKGEKNETVSWWRKHAYFFVIVFIWIFNLISFSCFDLTLFLKLKLCIYQIFSQQNSNVKIKLTDLNEDCLYLIFDHLEVDELMKMGETNSHFHTSISSVFRRKYSDYEIRIQKSAPIRRRNNKQQRWWNSLEFIFIVWIF